MPDLPPSLSIAPARGLDATSVEAAAVRRFWHRHGGPEGDDAVARLADLVCVARAPDGEVLATNSVFAADVPLVGRPLWVYRSLLAGAAGEHDDEMVRSAFGVLNDEFAQESSGPLGMCLLLTDAAEMHGRPQMEWDDPRLMYMGYLRDGRQVRVAYFDDARVGPGLDGTPPAPGGGERFRIEPFAAQDAVGEREVLELWEREGAVEPREARRRLEEVLLIATREDGVLAAVASVYLARNEQLGMDFWHFRTFVAQPHRTAGLALRLISSAHDLLRDRYLSGEDRRGAGVLVEVQNPVLTRGVNQAVWPRTGFVFVGENAYGEHVRVRPFPGALVPPPPAP